jgi:hypothetical protein
VGNYIKQVDFAIKDTFDVSNPAKVIKGTEFNTEYDLIATAISEKPDSANGTHTGTTSIASLSLNGTPITVSGAELNTLENITGNVQNLITARMPKAGGTFTGAVDVTAQLSSDTLSVGNSNPFTVTDVGKVTANAYVSATEFRIGAVPIVDNSRNATFNSVTTTGFTFNGDTITAIGDYSSGTFVPVIANANTGGTEASVGSAAGRWIKVGKQVTVNLRFTNVDTTGFGPADSVYIRALPFTAVDDAVATMFSVGSMFVSNVNNPTGTDSGSWIPVCEDNTDYLTVRSAVSNSGQPELLLFDDLNDDVADLYATITYETA